MKSAHPELIALLEAARETGQAINQVELYDIALQNGTTLFLTTADTPVLWTTRTYLTNPPIDLAGSRSTGHWKTGLDVDTWTLMLAPRAVEPVTGAPFPDRVGTTPWIQAARTGLLDRAQVNVHRGYALAGAVPYSNPRSLYEVLEDLFVGFVGDIAVDSTTITLTINSPLELLGIHMPRNLYSASCRHTLYDTGCTLNAGSFGLPGTVDAVYAGFPNQFHSPLATAAGSGDYTRGYIRWGTGLNAFTNQSVIEWFAGNFTLRTPPPMPVAVGDTFTAYPGCNKGTDHCNAFANILNFGGQPFIPAPELAV